MEDILPPTSVEVMMKRSQSRGAIGGVGVGMGGGVGEGVTMMKRSQSRGTIITTQDSSNSIHTYSEEEKEGLVDYVNALLRRQQRPINPKTSEIFEHVKDGVLLCRIVNAIQPGLIDETRIHTPPPTPTPSSTPSSTTTPPSLSIFEKGENLMLALQTSQDAFNISLVNIGVQDVLEGRPVLVLSLLWQLVTVDLRTRVRFHSREIDYLLQDELDGADVDESEGLQEEYKIVLRWVNHHLSIAGVEKRVHNFSNDFKDSVALIVLLNRLAPRTCTLDALKEPLISTRATLLLQSAEMIGCNKFLSPNDITQGNARSIFAFLAYLFTRFNKPVEVRKVEERIEEQAIELADIHQEIESIVDNINLAQDKIKESSQKLALQRDDVKKERDVIQQRITLLEDERKTQAASRNERIVALNKALVEAQALPSAAELTVAIAAEQAEQEAIHKSREETLAKMAVLRSDVTTTVADRVREEILLSRVDKKITKMEEKHTSQSKTLTDKIDALGLTSLKQRLDDAIAQNAAASKANETLTITRDDLADKVKTEGAARTKASAARQRIEAQLAKAKTELSTSTTTKAHTVAASTRLEKKLVAIKSEIGKVKKDTIFVEYQTNVAKEDTENVKVEVKGIIREKTQLLAAQENLEDEVEVTEDEIKEIQRVAEEEAMRLKNKKEIELTLERKANNEVIEQLEVSKEKSASKLTNAQADLISKQIQQLVRGNVVNIYDGEVQRLKQQVEAVQVDAKALQREHNLLSQKHAHTQKVVSETVAQSLEDAKEINRLGMESKEVMRNKGDIASRRDNLQEDIRQQEAIAYQADVDANNMAAVLADTLREERTLTQIYNGKEKENAAEKEERKREAVLAAKASAQTIKMNKEKEEFEKKIQQLTGKDNSHKIAEKSGVLESLQKGVEKLKREQDMLANEANDTSKKIHDVSKEKTEIHNNNKTLSQEHTQVSNNVSDKKREVDAEGKAVLRLQLANGKHSTYLFVLIY